MEEIEHLFEIYWSLYEVYCDNLELAYFLIVNCAEAEEIENWHELTMSVSRHFKLDTSHVIRHFKLLDPPIFVLFVLQFDRPYGTQNYYHWRHSIDDVKN